MCVWMRAVVMGGLLSGGTMLIEASSVAGGCLE